MNIKTAEVAESPIRFGSLKHGDIFKGKLGFLYMKTISHSCRQYGEFKTNCVSLIGTHCNFWNDDDLVFICSKIEMSSEQ